MTLFTARPLLAAATQRLLLLTLMLSTLATLHMAGGLLVFNEQPLAMRLSSLASFWVGQFCASAGMLWVLARRYPGVPDQGPGRGKALASLVCWTALAGLVIQALAALPRLTDWSTLHQSLVFGWLWNLSLAVPLALGHDFEQRSHRATDALHGSELRRLSLTREMDAARLQLLKAQVEPHFLFNALANVRRLLRTEPSAARTLLGDLLRYLEEALPALRDEHTTLGREAELVRAFLAVHQVRMGARLQTHIDIPPELADRTVPPMALLTLVENALKHGLQPLVDGGRIDVQARHVNGHLVLTVADTGRGMGSGSGGGTGLASLRALLRSLHGPQAQLALAINEPRGMVATVTLPDTPPAAGGSAA